MMGLGAHLDGKVADLFDLVVIPAKGGRVDLKGQPQFLTIPHGLHGFLKGTFQTAERVVILLGGHMEGYCHSRSSRIDDILDHLLGEQDPVGPVDGPQSEGCRVSREFKDVLPHEGFAPREHHEFETCLGDLVQELESFLRGQFSPGLIPCIPIAVFAGQITSVRRIPRCQQCQAPYVCPEINTVSSEQYLKGMNTNRWNQYLYLQVSPHDFS